MLNKSNLPLENYTLSSSSSRLSKPKISVLVITYNHDKYILKCLKSLNSQVLNCQVEYFITDDNSTDKTSNIINSFVSKNPNFFHLLRNVNLGKYTKNGRHNLLHGLTFLRGKFISICDGDDYWTDPYKLQKQVDYLEANPNCSICTHWVKTKDETGQGLDEDAFSSKDRKNPLTRDDLFIDDGISSHGSAYHPLSWVFQAKLINHIPDWIHKIRGGDDVLFTEFIQHGYCYCIPEFMGTYRITKNSSWAPLHARTKSLSQMHFLQRVKRYYPNYTKRIIILIEKQLNDWKNWPCQTKDNFTILQELLLICKRDLQISLSMLIFCTKFWFHQYYFKLSSLLRINAGRWKDILSHRK